ncbi:MAG: response regulator [Deltaproteobacteria bacterium]|nr:response regulator [Candidatus Tharpella sp.]
MQILLIADRDEETRKRIAGFFNESEYSVIETDSVDVVLHDVLKKDARVILLGSEFDGLSAIKIIPLLKKCNQNLTIILISNEESPAIIRRFRREGIFYHALKPVNSDDQEELRQVVQCAFDNSSDKIISQKTPAGRLCKERPTQEQDKKTRNNFKEN